jgi:hypothetical protein
MRLLEAIKARAAIDYINQSLALGRKVVVFHDYNEGGGINPFDLSSPTTPRLRATATASTRTSRSSRSMRISSGRTRM